jgi:hypothetical protein
VAIRLAMILIAHIHCRYVGITVTNNIITIAVLDATSELNVTVTLRLQRLRSQIFGKIFKQIVIPVSIVVRLWVG